MALLFEQFLHLIGKIPRQVPFSICCSFCIFHYSLSLSPSLSLSNSSEASFYGCVCVCLSNKMWWIFPSREVENFEETKRRWIIVEIVERNEMEQVVQRRKDAFVRWRRRRVEGSECLRYAVGSCCCCCSKPRGNTPSLCSVLSRFPPAIGRSLFRSAPSTNRLPPRGQYGGSLHRSSPPPGAEYDSHNQYN